MTLRVGTYLRSLRFCDVLHAKNHNRDSLQYALHENVTIPREGNRHLPTELWLLVGTNCSPNATSKYISKEGSIVDKWYQSYGWAFLLWPKATFRKGLLHSRVQWWARAETNNYPGIHINFSTSIRHFFSCFFFLTGYFCFTTSI